jgi:hypothetical protein
MAQLWEPAGFFPCTHYTPICTYGPHTNGSLGNLLDTWATWREFSRNSLTAR